MGFNINGPSNQPIIQASQSLGKDGGGGGNTGYMNMRDKKKDERNKEDENESVVLEEEEPDTFTKEKGENKKENKILGVISKFIKDKNKNSDKDTFVKSSKEKKEEKEEEIFNKPVFENYYDDVDI